MSFEKKVDGLSRALKELAKKDNVTGKQIIEAIKTYFDVDNPFLYSLINCGIIKKTRISGSIQDYNFRIDLHALSDKAKIYQAIGSKPIDEEFILLVSCPEKSGKSSLKNIEEIYPRICRLIMSSKKDILMVNPYFDEKGIRKILPYIAAASKRGVRIRVAVRKDGNSNSFIDFIIKNVSNKIEAKYFGGEGYYLHAKCIISDASAAYIGSANLTGTSLGSNLELGVLFTGHKVKILLDFLEKVLDIEGD